MLLKKKSIVVAIASSLLISAVLVLTLTGYALYVEWKAEEFKSAYRDLLNKTNARWYSKNIAISGLSAKLGGTGPLKGKPVLEGLVTNKGPRDIADILLRVKFLDKDGAVIYDVIFNPQESSLGSSVLTKIPIPYMKHNYKMAIRANGALPFKKIISGCPGEILRALKEPQKSFNNRWSGRFTAEIVSIEF